MRTEGERAVAYLFDLVVPFLGWDSHSDCFQALASIDDDADELPVFLDLDGRHGRCDFSCVVGGLIRTTLRGRFGGEGSRDYNCRNNGRWLVSLMDQR
jgi:hypothetical protein